VTSLQSSEVHIDAGQSLGSTGRDEEESFKFRVRDSLIVRELRT